MKSITNYIKESFKIGQNKMVNVSHNDIEAVIKGLQKISNRTKNGIKINQNDFESDLYALMTELENIINGRKYEIYIIKWIRDLMISKSLVPDDICNKIKYDREKFETVEDDFENLGDENDNDWPKKITDKRSFILAEYNEYAEVIKIWLYGKSYGLYIKIL